MRTAEAEGRGRPGAEAASAVLRSAPARPGFGLGFRSRYFDALTRDPRAVEWLEVIADTYIGAGGPRRDMLSRLRADHPVALHCEL